ncbi:MAG: PASTA domain-containing protein [Bacteroidota bacterium]|nr:PASTA domain-containing protein [Bacteroidota bacterium]MDP4289675.1 PASTA domain-containing protein [Bacteroidota bacterium]
MSKSFIEFIKSRIFLRHLLVSVLITIALLFAVFQILAVYTFHGSEVTVPDYEGLTLNELKASATYSDFDFVVVDSVYDPHKEKGTIVTQDPLPNSKVKQHRKIYLTVIASVPEKVSMPDLKDLTLRQAIATLQTYGLQLGRTELVPDIGTNAVLKQMFQGHEVKPGTMMEKGAVIDLVLGQGLGGTRIKVPFLIGMTRSAVLKLLSADSLYVGAEIYMDKKDTVNARVYKQSPAYSSGLYLNIGQSIDLWFKSDESFDWNTYMKSFDTTSSKKATSSKRDEF